jgi:hypothetical protein
MDLAVATGYSLRYVGDIERGMKSATLRTMNDLATLFDMGLGALITEAEGLLMAKRRENTSPLARKGRSFKKQT